MNAGLKLKRILRRPFSYCDFNATTIILAINVGIFLFCSSTNFWQMLGIKINSSDLSRFFGLSFYGVVKELHIWQFITYMFFHDSRSITHILFNMLALYMFGRALEQHIGSKEFLLYYFLCGIFAGVFHFLLGGLSYYIALQSDSNAFIFAVSPLIGASGAIFALLLAYGIYFSESIIFLFGIIPLKARIAILLFAAIELFCLFNVPSTVSNITHIGGLVAGILYFFIRQGINPFKVLFPKKRSY